MRRFGGLPENLVGFCAFLRREYAFRIGAGELLDAARALDIVDLSNHRAVRYALRAVLAATHEDVVAFDSAFDRFFLSPRGSGFPDDHPSAYFGGPETGPGDPDRDGGRRRKRATEAPAVETDASAARTDQPSSFDASDDDREASSAARASYSPLEADGGPGPEFSQVDEAWRQAARALVRRVQLGPARRWRTAPKGRRFDLRRTLRANLQTGGELLSPRWLARPRRTARFVVLIDGSRSMGEHAATALTLASALAGATSRMEAFTFSTALRRITPDIRGAGARRANRLPDLASAWGGGTCIGECLAEFLRRFAERLLAASTVVIVVSDGLDVGGLDTLRASMRALHRRSAAVVWLNPLVDTPGYEPTAVGMSAVRPFITTFTSVNDPASLSRLARTVRLR